MKRVAIFVEGQTELIFVREFLLRWFNYEIDLECRALRGAVEPFQVPYDFPNPSTSLHFQIISVGMDESVLSQILLFYNAGYESIIGLRDMFCEAYIKAVKNRNIDLLENETFRQETDAIIKQRSQQAERVKFCFAIMELEAWWLGISSLWANLEEPIRKQFKDAFTHPEAVFHPSVLIKTIQQSRQKDYKKREDQVESIVSQISREDYAELHDSQRCPSFCEFVRYIQPQLN